MQKKEAKQNSKLWGVILGLSLFLLSELISEEGLMRRPTTYYLILVAFSLGQLTRHVHKKMRNKSLETPTPLQDSVIDDSDYAFDPEDFKW